MQLVMSKYQKTIKPIVYHITKLNNEVMPKGSSFTNFNNKLQQKRFFTNVHHQKPSTKTLNNVQQGHTLYLGAVW